jgi:hypothetical protein
MAWVTIYTNVPEVVGLAQTALKAENRLALMLARQKIESGLRDQLIPPRDPDRVQLLQLLTVVDQKSKALQERDRRARQVQRAAECQARKGHNPDSKNRGPGKKSKRAASDPNRYGKRRGGRK